MSILEYTNHITLISDSKIIKDGDIKNLGVYFILSFATVILILCQSLVQWLLCAISSSKTLLQGMLALVLRGQCNFLSQHNW